MFEVEYPWNGWIKKDGLSADLINTIVLTLYSPIDFALSPRLNVRTNLFFLSI